ncbi:hypothetical protein ACIGO7_35490 [Streptomyces virginiae]|uniref:hypothetical protein n=1 Tax=Streptomyces virginiae TaxID=1961 RepID=UPI00344F7B4F
MTPADEIKAAAQLLIDTADEAQEDLDTSDYWKSYDKHTAWRDGFVNGFGGVSSELAALFPPSTAKMIGQWLRAYAEHLAATTHPGWQEATGGPALAVARALLGTTDGSHPDPCSGCRYVPCTKCAQPDGSPR